MTHLYNLIASMIISPDSTHAFFTHENYTRNAFTISDRYIASFSVSIQLCDIVDKQTSQRNERYFKLCKKRPVYCGTQLHRNV